MSLAKDLFLDGRLYADVPKSRAFGRKTAGGLFGPSGVGQAGNFLARWLLFWACYLVLVFLTVLPNTWRNTISSRIA